MPIRNAAVLRGSEITDPSLYTRRNAILGGVGLAAGTPAGDWTAPAESRTVTGSFPIPEEPSTQFDKITSYNNYYEFGTGKFDPSVRASGLRTSPWSVTIDGECLKPATIAIEDLVRPEMLEKRIYRHHCVEGWSMVIPWDGFSLSGLLKRVEPTSVAKYVAFEMLLRPGKMPGQRLPIRELPYSESLRRDEAMNDLTILADGLYGRALPNQNAAPLRLATPRRPRILELPAPDRRRACGLYKLAGTLRGTLRPSTKPIFPPVVAVMSRA